MNRYALILLMLCFALVMPAGASGSYVVASNNIQYSDTAEVSYSGNYYTFAKQLTMTQDYIGSMRICYDLMGDYDSQFSQDMPGYAKIYINGVPYGIERAAPLYSYSSYCDDYLNLNLVAGNDIQVYFHGTDDYQVSLKNFVVKFDITSPIPSPTTTISPTPTPQPPALGKVADTISIAHTTSFCKPVPIDYYDPAAVPQVYDCNNMNVLYLDQFPLDELPSGGQSQRISSGEMALLFAELNNFPTAGYMNFTFYNMNTNTLLFYYVNNYPACAGNCDWIWWNWHSFAYTGHFSWEINSPGFYNASVSTPWGYVTYNFEVRATTPQTKTLTIHRVSGSGYAVVNKNDAYFGEMSSADTSVVLNFNTSDTYEIQPIASTGYVLQKYCMDVNCNTQGVNTSYIYGEITNSNVDVYLYYVLSNTLTLTDVILTNPSSSSIGIFVQSAGQGTYGLSIDGAEMETKQMTQSGSASFLFGSLSPGLYQICAYDVLEATTDKICKSITLTAPTPSPTPIVSPTPQPTNTPNPNGIVSFYVTQADATIKITGGITKQVDLYPTNVSCSNQEFIISRSGYYSYRDKCFSNSYHISLTPTGSLGKAYIGDIIDPYIWFQGITTQANGTKQAIIAVKRDLSFPEYDVMLTFNDHSINRIPMAEITGYYNVSDKYFNISTIGSNYISFSMANAQICDPLATKAAYLCDGSNINTTTPGTTPGITPGTTPSAPIYTPSADILARLNSLNELIGILSFVPPMIGLIISLILMGLAYWYGKNESGSDVGMIFAVLTGLISFATGLLKWYILLFIVVIVVVVAIAYMRRDD